MRRLLAGALALCLAWPAAAETIRVATFDTGLGARGPGLLLRDIVEGEEPRIDAVVAMIAEAAPDVIVLQDIDYDAGGAALSALADRIGEAGLELPHRFAARPNSGMMTEHDLDGDGLRGGPRDAQGYGRFAGSSGMAILSRFPVGAVVDLSSFLWRDLPGGMPPEDVPPDQRLSSVAHWIAPVETPAGPLTLMTWRATPPIFDGPEDRNGRRANDEAALWLRLLDGDLEVAPPDPPFVILGVGNVDPEDGEGVRDSLTALLSRPDITPLAPVSEGGAAGADPAQSGDPAVDTAEFGGSAGNLRVSYLLPSRDLSVTQSGVLWPAPGTPLAERLGPAEHWPTHRLVWADLTLP